MKMIMAIYSFFTLPKQDSDRGATIVEYALLVALIAVVAVVAITAFGTQLAAFFGGLGGQLFGTTTVL